MRYFLLFFLLLSLPVLGDVFFVPGWRTGFDGRELSVNILKKTFPATGIVVKSWDSLQPWDVTKRNAVVHTGKLLEEIIALPEKEREELILIGHSIGADIVVDILCQLEKRGMKVHSAALLGAALPDDDPRIVRALEALRNYCCIVYNPDDWVLRYLFPLDNSMHSPLGLNGWTGKDFRVYEIRAESDRYGFCNHYAYIYVENLDRLIRKLPREFPDVTVIQDEPNTVRIPADMVYWETVDTFRNWQLQKSVYGKYRILDPWGKRRANGSKEKMQTSFADIQEQLGGQ